MKPILVTRLVATILAAAAATTPTSIAADETLDTAFVEYWAAKSDAEIAAASASILATRAAVEDVRSRLKAGRIYTNPIAKGRLLLSRENRDGIAHAYVLHVPESYDPAISYPVRVYLHGGVMRPLSVNGEWWPNNGRLARDDALVVFPASWANSIWWHRSQVENLVGLLNDLKREYNVDENRVHLLGVSDGATGAYYHAFKATTPWAGFLPFNGHPAVLSNLTSSVDGDMYVTNLRNKPFFVVNGANDRLYPASSVAEYVQLFEQAGSDIDFRPQAGSGHDMRWWPLETDNIDAFVRDTPRVPLPDELSWETESEEEFNRSHWLVIDALGSVEGESELDPVNTLVDEATRTPLGINMLGELVNRLGLKLLDVGPDSIAARSGLMVDDLILAIDGVSIPNVQAFRNAIIGFSPGEQLPVRIERSGVELGLTLSYPVAMEARSRPAFLRRLSSGRVDLVRQDNTVTASTQGVLRFRLLLSAAQFDFSRPVRVLVNGVVSHEALVSPDVATLLHWAAIDQDRSLLFTSELHIEVPPQLR